MILETGYPPNIEKIRKYLTPADNAVFTYGDKLYNPNDGHITGDLVVHEKVHQVQQGDNPEAWWDKYLIDADFRYQEELSAYRSQYRFAKTQHLDRNRLALFLDFLATSLASDMYKLSITKNEAWEAIKKGI